MIDKYALLFCIFLSLALSAFAAEFSFSPEKLNEIKKNYGEGALKRMQALESLINSKEKFDEMGKLKAVNDFFNQIPYQTDIKTWKQNDYWATRSEFVCVARGDCEDYAIAKYFTLIQMDVSGEKLFLSYVKSLKYNVAHMVLTYFKTPKTAPLVLDNYEYKILPATQRKDLVPVYSFNAESLYLAKQAGLGKVVPSGLQKNKKWLEILDKTKKGE